MSAPWDSIVDFFVRNAWGTAAALLTLLCAAVATYARDQVRAGTTWALAPLTRALPWNSANTDPTIGAPLFSELTLVDVFLLNVAGTFARYQKTSCYVVDREVAAYHEGVTAEGRADEFSTMRGVIVSTTREHGFYLSRIDLGAVLKQGSRLTNTYMADLHGCFINTQEHWTQEILYPTKHLTLRIHFPNGRPPKSVACKIVEGSSERPVPTSAQIMELFGRKSIALEIEKPKAGQVLKLEWMW